eukprot:jgi/Mesvir1/1618/Mv26226-RA.1
MSRQSSLLRKSVEEEIDREDTEDLQDFAMMSTPRPGKQARYISPGVVTFCFPHPSRAGSPRARNEKRPRLSLAKQLDDMKEREFRMRYKITKDRFQAVAERMRECGLEPNHVKAANSRGSRLTCEMKLAAFVRWAAGGR